MANRTLLVERLCRSGVIAMIRSTSDNALPEVARALMDGGVDCIEITLNTPNALAVIAKCRSQLGQNALIGAGTVMEACDAVQAIQAGAQFIVSPVFNKNVIAVAHEWGLPAIPGALTPNEVHAANAAGADMVKVFPVSSLGSGYIRELLGPMSKLKLVPTGGINHDNAAGFISAGAATLGVGSALLPKQALENGDLARIQELAVKLVKVIAQARALAGGSSGAR